jgi:hypothetical protein
MIITIFNKSTEESPYLEVNMPHLRFVIVLPEVGHWTLSQPVEASSHYHELVLYSQFQYYPTIPAKVPEVITYLQVFKLKSSIYLSSMCIYMKLH